MKLISWNVNGLRACAGKGFAESVMKLDADVICLQETKLSPDQMNVSLPGYEVFLSSAEKKGYSGTALFTRAAPLRVSYGMGIEEHDHEGRIIVAEYPDFQLVNCYTPNAQRGLTRLDYRMKWEDDFRAFLSARDAEKPVILCGDLNVAHEAIDLKNPGSNHENAGFTDQERGKMTELLGAGFIDSFRYFYPDKAGEYSWWSYMFNARANNAGWRIDYFLVSEKLRDRMLGAAIHQQIMGSDHCPVELTLS